MLGYREHDDRCCADVAVAAALLAIRYDTRCYFNVHSKADISQLNLAHETDN